MTAESACNSHDAKREKSPKKIASKVTLIIPPNTPVPM
ncbi:hypothetical protein FB99_46630 (plasmid) [Pantoea agglomerans]|nr:hypothetical protein FB99_46630 [Pantoea agglomerans]